MFWGYLVRLTYLGMLLALCLGAYWALLFAQADHLYRHNTLDSLRTAVWLVPGNASYHELLAEHEEGAGLNPDPDFKSAALLSPMESSYWIRLAFREESRRDFSGAETYLMEAVKVDRKFAPRWALMNYYFRRGDAAQFWRWTREALAMSYGDLTPIFRLCWEMTSDAQVVARALPQNQKETLVKYLNFVTDNQHWDAAHSVAESLVTQADSEGVPSLLQYCDRSLDKDGSSALFVWNSLCQRKLLPFDRLVPERGSIVTNGNFSTISFQHGFDWRIPPSEGVSVTLADAPEGVAVKMSGSEPEDCLLLSQTIPVSASTEYVIAYETRSSDLHPQSGISWDIIGIQSGGLLAQSIMAASADAWLDGRLKFSTGANRTARLELRYKREPGTTRAEGTLLIRRIVSDRVR